MSVCRLIVHADDFGLSEKVNEGIIQAYRDGIVTSTSVMATGRGLEHAMQCYQAVPGLDLGVHLTLTEEKPVLESNAVPSLVDAAGRFHNHATTFIRRYVWRQISLEEVRRELEAQIRKVLRYDVTISHVDGHQHVHMLPKIRKIIVGLAKKYGIPAIRFPREKLGGYMLREKRALPRIVQLLVLDVLCGLGRNEGILRTDHFVGFLFGGALNKRNMKKVLERLPRTGTCELMCHPGVFDPNCHHSHWGYMWEEELEALTDPELIDLLHSKRVQLITYRELRY